MMMTIENCSPKHNETPNTVVALYIYIYIYDSEFLFLITFLELSRIDRSERAGRLGLLHCVIVIFYNLFSSCLFSIANRDANRIEVDEHDERR